jgi:hypothetical protein
MFKTEQIPWFYAGGRGLSELIDKERKYAIIDYAVRKHKRTRSEIPNSSIAMKQRFFEMGTVQTALSDYEKPLVGMQKDYRIPKNRVSPRPPSIALTAKTFDDIEARTETSFYSDEGGKLSKSKCAVRPYFYGCLPGGSSFYK